ncbi:unnamed protein product [Candidula unifasciata]|uniref:RNA helicase n=1 Tax=Candidula unifasciata TaxID=100452 RepID=A0A8S3ZQ17_9EUPU|nr:unnamed protein product [Candidula unifasciata]
MIKEETHVQGFSTNSKDILQSGNLISQQEEPLKVTYKEIEVHSDYDEHENAGVSITENSLQPSDVSVTKKTFENSSANIKVENYEQVTGVTASGYRKHQTDLMSLSDEIQRSSHQNSDTSARSSHQNSDTSARSSHQNSDTDASSSHQNSDIGAGLSHQDSETDARSSRQNSDTGARLSHQNSDTGARLSYQNSDIGAGSSNQNSDTGARSSLLSAPDTGSLTGVMPDFQELSLLSDKWDPSIQPDEIPLNSQHSDPHSGSSDLEQTPEDPHSSPSNQQQTVNKLMLNVTSSLSNQHPDPHSSPSDFQQTPFNPHPSSSDLQQASNRTSQQHFNPHPSSSDLQQTSNRTFQQDFNPHPSSSDLQQTSNNSNSSSSHQHQTLNKMLNVASFLSHQSPLPNSSLTDTTSNKSAHYYFDGSSGYCYCCSIELTSLQHANQHLHGQKHKKRSEQWELTSALQNGPSQQTPAPTQQFSPPNGNLANLASNKSAPYYFDGSKGYCYCCTVELTSVQHANQHLYGQRHKKRSEQWELTSALKNEPSPQTQALPEQQVQHPTEDSSYYFNGDRGFCHVCNIELTSFQHAQQHISGKPHKRTKERFNRTQNGIAYPLNCQICSKIFTGQESAQQHFTSANHKIKAEVLNESVKVLTVVDEGRVVMKDGQVWHVCDLCKVAMNSREQFLFHKESLKHKRECENSKNRISFSENGPVEFINNAVLQDPSNYIYKTSSCTSSSRASSVETVQEELDTAALRYSQAKFEDQQIQGGANRQKVLDENRHYLMYSQAPVVSAVSNSSSALNQTSGSKSNADGRSQGQHRQTGLGSVSSDHSKEPAQPTSAEASSANSQIYDDFWQSLRADGGHNAGLGFTPTPQMRGGAILANSSGGRSQSYSGAGTHFSDPHSSGSGTPISNPQYSGSINQGATGFSLDDNTEDDLDSGQNHLNSASGDDSFSNPDNLGNVIMKPRPSKSRGRGNERLRNGVLSLDKKEFDDDFDNGYEEENRDDLNIIEEVPPEVPTPPAEPMRSGKPGFRYYCPICNKHMNTREAYETHAQGKYHIYMLSSCPAPVRKLEPICKINRDEGDVLSRVWDIISKQLNIQPRVYQIELVLKAMKGDCIIYLPTGTGKTLVAVLTMGLMLQDNPSRPVLFLVDKVLLVMQQAQYIIRHFAGTLFKRQDGPLGSPPVTRELQVKPICGGMTTKTDLPVWKHDIVVTTAAYCANMLERKQIRWEDFSLVVLDEVHHCGKGHPYHKLMSTYHCSLPEHARAKVLGLTASPAGKSTVEQTYTMLKSLLANLGGASVAVVEEENDCLDHYQSMAKVKPICVPMSSKEKDFKGRLLEYIVLCYSQLALMTHNLRSDEPPCSFFLDAVRKPGDREVASQLAEKFMKDPEPLSEVLDVIFKARCIDEVDVTGRNRFDNLRLHICQLLLIIPEVGSGADIEELLGHLSPSGITEEFKKMGLPCDQIYERAVLFANDGNNDLTMFSKLVETLQDPDLISWADTSSRALVLVRERKRARQYCLKLRAHPMVEKKNLRVGHIVGHGKGAKDGGMDVKKQRKVFDNHEKYHILVATSIMEEGIDIQALQLVVCMNPPNSLRALVQMRGRARRQGSHFVVLCSSQEDVDKLNSLQKQEQNMQQAAKRCLEESK